MPTPFATPYTGALSVVAGMVTAGGKPVRGAAAVVNRGRTVRVLPAETIRAVNTAFGLLGKPYGVSATGPERYGCLGVAQVGRNETGLPTV